MKVLVTGGRTWGDPATLPLYPTKYEVERKRWEHDQVFAFLDELDRQFGITELAHGGATGADTVAGEWAASQGHITIHVYRADWNAPCNDRCFHKPRKRLGQAYCPVAGLRRNEKMLSDFDPDKVVAFPGGTGTEHMVKISLRALKEVLHGG